LDAFERTDDETDPDSIFHGLFEQMHQVLEEGHLCLAACERFIRRAVDDICSTTKRGNPDRVEVSELSRRGISCVCGTTTNQQAALTATAFDFEPDPTSIS